MRIAIFTHWFIPHMGGQQVRADMLARSFMAAGHEVRVLTAIQDPNGLVQRDYIIERGSKWRSIFRMARWSEVCLVLGPSVKYVIPPLLVGKRVLVSHAAPFMFQERLLHTVLQWLCSHAASWTLPAHGPSLSIWEHLPHRRVHFHNPYDEGIFKPMGLPRDGDFLYVGRLSKEKGVDTLLCALARLHAGGRKARLSILGKGSQEIALRTLAGELKLEGYIDWLGQAFGNTVAETMNRHQVLVVPSRWKEPFGIVALEGLACGCRLVVSRHGGLTEASGAFARVFENGNDEELATAMQMAFEDTGYDSQSFKLREHLMRHTTTSIAQRYLELFQG